MARPKTIHIDQDAILAGIVAAYREDLTEAQARQQRAEATYAASSTPDRYHNWQAVTAARRLVSYIERYGIPYEIPRFFGRPPSASERLRIQGEIRSLEDAGRVERTGRDIRPILETPAETQTNGA